jgi:tetratricopeptide (TPR) repeat protein
MMWRCVTLAALLLTPRLASAQSETKAAVAEALYRQARDLMAAGKYDEACPKLAQSQQLDPATGTLLNLAACHEKQGKLATAWLEYSDALVAARRDGREDRVQYARERAAELEPKLSRLTLLLAPNADAPGLSIELDSTSVGSAVFGVPTPVDPGKHSVRASAPGKKPQIFSIEVAVADQRTFSIPPLEDAPVVASPAEPTPQRPGGATNPEQPRSDALEHRPIPTSVYLAGGITLALAASASVTGVAYLNKRSDYEALAKSEGLTDAVEDRRDKAQRYGYANLGLWVGTAIGAGVTTYLYVTRPTRQSAIRVSPWLGPQVAGLGVGGGF